jgi:hypothetical protein
VNTNPGIAKGSAVALIMGALVAVSACTGIIHPSGQGNTAVQQAAGPDKCSKCHNAWSKAFDYYRGWDRYGPIFDGEEIVAPVDPWLFPKVRNTAREFYTSKWWDAPELYVWPTDIAQRAFSMSSLSGNRALSAAFAGQDTVGAHVLFVSAAGGGNYDTIQKAVDAASPGMVVFVREGTYHESVRLKSGIRLIGQNPLSTVIDPQNTGHGIAAANNCRISGFTLTGTTIDYVNNRMNAGIYAHGCDSTLVITGNIFKENGLFGIWVEGVIDSVRNAEFDRLHPGNTVDYADRPYLAYANPVIAGNTFYRIGQRAVFLLHGRSEIFNNIFIGNVKTIGMERHSRPMVHHNVFYLNNIPMAINRSEPIVFNNIMYHNQWGQRVLKGSNPAIFGNVTWESPHFRDFDESGRPIPYRPIPGTGELEVDPLFVDPPKGDFHFKPSSTLQNQTNGFRAVGIMRDPGMPQPPQVACEGSYGREVLALTDDILDLIRKIDSAHAKIQSVEATYRIEYTGNYTIEPGPGGAGGTVVIAPEGGSFRMEYEVAQWAAKGNQRTKTFHEHVTKGAEDFTDTGASIFNGSWLEVKGSRYAEDFPGAPDARYIADRPFREAPLGIYRDYDQYYLGSIGSMGTFFVGYLRVLGGKIEEKPAKVDGVSCTVVRYPHIGNDQYYCFFLDPKHGYRPMKLVHYIGGKPFRVIGSYRYREFSDGISMPVSVTVTDYVVSGIHAGEKAGEWKLLVNENSLLVNGKTSIGK